MEVKEVKKKKEELIKDIQLLVRNFNLETGVKVKGIKVTSFYVKNLSSGTHTVDVNIINPF